MKTLVVNACGASREIAITMALKALGAMVWDGTNNDSTVSKIDGSATAKFVPTPKNRPTKKGKK